MEQNACLISSFGYSTQLVKSEQILKHQTSYIWGRVIEEKWARHDSN